MINQLLGQAAISKLGQRFVTRDDSLIGQFIDDVVGHDASQQRAVRFVIIQCNPQLVSISAVVARDELTGLLVDHLEASPCSIVHDHLR